MHSFETQNQLENWMKKCVLMVFGLLGGLRKIPGLCYTDGPEIPRRSRQLVWRAAVEMSKNASQLALQVCCLFCKILCSLPPFTLFRYRLIWQHE